MIYTPFLRGEGKGGGGGGEEGFSLRFFPFCLYKKKKKSLILRSTSYDKLLILSTGKPLSRFQIQIGIFLLTFQYKETEFHIVHIVHTQCSVRSNILSFFTKVIYTAYSVSGHSHPNLPICSDCFEQFAAFCQGSPRLVLSCVNPALKHMDLHKTKNFNDRKYSMFSNPYICLWLFF